MDLSNINNVKLGINSCNISLQSYYGTTPQIAMLSRADLKWIIRRDQIREAYIMAIRIAKEKRHLNNCIEVRERKDVECLFYCRYSNRDPKP